RGARGTRALSLHDALPIYQAAVLLRGAVAGSVGDVDRRRAGGDRGAHEGVDELGVGAHAVLGAELDLLGVAPGVADHLVGEREDLVPGLPEHVLQVHVAGRGEDVDHRPPRRLEGLRRPVDVGDVGARQRAHDRALDLAGDRAHALEVALAGDREARFYDVDAEPGEGVRDLELLGGVESHARALLAVAQRRVEEADVAHAPTSCGPSSTSSWRPMNGIIALRDAPTCASWVSAALRLPVFKVGWPTSLSSRNSRAKAPERMFLSTSCIAFLTSAVTIFGAVT